jgi:putative ABC transport system permease protein
MGARHGAGGRLSGGNVVNLRSWLTRTASMVQKRKLDAELDEDIRLHLQLAADENVRRGMPADEAMAAAKREFGNVERMKEDYRHERGLPLLEVIGRDVRLSLRSLGRTPLFALVAILTVGIGIGANTAIFSVVHGILTKRLPYADADRLSLLMLNRPQQNLERMPLSLADYLDWRERNTVYDKVAAYGNELFNITGGGDVEQVTGAVATSGFFDVLGVPAAAGRTFLPGEDQPGAAPGVVISHSLWQRRFHGAADTVGRSIVLNGTAYTVLGILPADFEFGVNGAEVWCPLKLTPPQRRGPYFLWVVAHRRDSVTAEQAAAQNRAISGQLETAYPKDNHGVHFVAAPLQEYMVGSLQKPLYVLQGAVLFVLLIASANVGHLILARATARERESAVRVALGATRSRLMSQWLTESMVLALIGGSIGVALAAWGTTVLKEIAPSNIPRLQSVALDRTVLLYTAVCSLVSAAVFGCLPVVRTSVNHLGDSLKAGGRGLQVIRPRLRSAVIIAEVALSLMLLVGAGLLLKSFLRLQSVDPGFTPSNVLSALISVDPSRYSTNEQLLVFYHELLERVRRIPGVVDAGLGNSLPPNVLELTDSFSIEGRPWPTEQSAPIGPVLFVTPEYFSTLSIPVTRGRNFSVDDRLNSVQVTIISETMAERYFPGQDPIGKRIKVGGPERPEAPWMEIIGIVGDAKYSGLETAFEPTRYQAISQVPWLGVYLVVKTAGEPSGIVAELRRNLAQIDPEVPLARLATMNDAMQGAVTQPRFRTQLLSVFSAIGLLLAAGGIYGVMSYSVSKRTQEIGLRMSLGARNRDVLWMVIGEGLALGCAGIVLGVIGSLALTRVLRTLLFEVTPTDPITFIMVSAFLLCVMLAACYLPARRAARVDPMSALKYE